MSSRAKRELARGTSWSSVRSGLGYVIVTWALLTLASASLEVLSFNAAAFARAGDVRAAAWLAGTGMIYQVAYFVASLALVVGAVKLTRAPPESRVHPPALAAAASFVAVALLSLVLASSRQSEERLSEVWLFVVIGRAVGVLSLLGAVVLVGRAAGAKASNAWVGAAFALACVDTGYPLYRLLAHSTSDLGTTSGRGVLLAVQLALALALIGLAVAARRAAARAPARPEAEPEPEADASAEPEPESDRDEPAEPRESAPPAPPAPYERWVGATLAGVALAILPLWDAVVATSSLSAFTDALGGAPGTELPKTGVAFAGGALLAAVLLARSMARAPYAARVVFSLVAIVAGGYALGTGYALAVSRSHQIDAWPVCDTGLDIRGDLPKPDDIYRGRYSGPRLIEGGEPCTEAAERRDLHVKESPAGGVQDGIIQIITRFPGDRARFFFGSFGVFLALGISGLTVARAARASRRRAP